MSQPMDTLTRIRQFLLEERSLFGEALIADKPDADVSSSHAEPLPMPAHKTTKVQSDLSLFDEGLAAEPWQKAQSLSEFDGMICNCTKCELGATRKNFVFGVGSPNATFMVIGEAPGADEDEQGEPFVGRAGQLLNKILAAIGFKREEVYIANILKCRPPGNATPTIEQSETCKPYLLKQIDLIRPKVILCVGRVAAQNLLGTNEAMGQLRGGRIFEFQGTTVMVTYHPAALLRNPNWKRPTWEDVQAARKVHDEILQREQAGGSR